jgi:hypothetical protein
VNCPTQPPAGTAARRDGVRDVQWTGGMPSARALGLGDVRLKLTRPIGAFSGSLRGLELVPAKWRGLVPPASTPKGHNASRWAADDIFEQEIEMTRNMSVMLYIVVMIAVVVSVDLLFFKNQFWERLTVNIGIILVFAAFYLRFLKNP